MILLLNREFWANLFVGHLWFVSRALSAILSPQISSVLSFILIRWTGVHGTEFSHVFNRVVWALGARTSGSLCHTLRLWPSGADRCLCVDVYFDVCAFCCSMGRRSHKRTKSAKCNHFIRQGDPHDACEACRKAHNGGELCTQESRCFQCDHLTDAQFEELL